MSVEKVVVLVRYRAQEGKAERALAELEALVRLVVAEPGCEGIAIHRGRSEPQEILLHERWSDAATYLGPHRETPHLQAFIARAGELFTGPPEITLWEAVG
jgi:quinol monooxygenase YgiN